MVAHTLNFKPIFNPLIKKLLGEPLSFVGSELARLGHFVAHVKISQHPLGAVIWPSEKIDLVGKH